MHVTSPTDGVLQHGFTGPSKLDPPVFRNRALMSLEARTVASLGPKNNE
jgi:hypothetical protein